MTRQAFSLSKVEQIQKHYQMQIRRGQLVAGDRLPPERDLAGELGVSLATINKAMAGLETQMLLHRKTSRGTYIHPNVSRGQVVVVFDTCHFANPEIARFYHHLLESLTSAIKSHGMRPIHILGHGNPGDEFIASLEPQATIWNQCAGVLAMAGLEQFELQLQQMGVPAVTITTLVEQGVHPVRLDYDDLLMKMYRHLCERGCRRIGIIFNNPLSACHVFTPGFKERLLQISPALDTRFWIDKCSTPAQGYQVMQWCWQQAQRPDGLIIVDDNTAMGVGQAVLDLGIDYPSQLKLITQATIGVPRDFPIDYTRCQFNLSRLCRAAFGLLYRLMLDDHKEQGVLLRPAFEQGATT